MTMHLKRLVMCLLLCITVAAAAAAAATLPRRASLERRMDTIKSWLGHLAPVSIGASDSSNSTTVVDGNSPTWRGDGTYNPGRPPLPPPSKVNLVAPTIKHTVILPDGKHILIMETDMRDMFNYFDDVMTCTALLLEEVDGREQFVPGEIIPVLSHITHMDLRVSSSKLTSNVLMEVLFQFSLGQDMWRKFPSYMRASLFERLPPRSSHASLESQRGPHLAQINLWFEITEEQMAAEDAARQAKWLEYPVGNSTVLLEHAHYQSTTFKVPSDGR